MIEAYLYLATIFVSAIIGIGASYIASKIFLHTNNKQNQPRILISDKFIKSKRKNGIQSLKIKLINKTDQDLTNIRITVQGFENRSPKGSIPLISLQHISNRELMYIKKFDIQDTNSEYAHQIHFNIEDQDIQVVCSEYKDIRLSITADCLYYNTSTIITKDYVAATDILDENHHFNTGDSLSVSS